MIYEREGNVRTSGRGYATRAARDACDLSSPRAAEDREHDERCRLALSLIYERQAAAGQRLDHAAALAEVRELEAADCLPPLPVLPADLCCSRCGRCPAKRRKPERWSLGPPALCPRCNPLSRLTGRSKGWNIREAPTVLDTIGKRVTHRKYALGLTTIQLARLCRTSDTTILIIENGRRRPSAAVLPRLCEVLGVSEAWLTEGER